MGRHALTQEEYVEKANMLHKNKYNYLKTEYANMKSRIVVTCPIHGDFEVEAANHVRVFKREDKKHLKPCGCPQCGKDEVRKRNMKNTKLTPDFINEANEVHGFKYSYEHTHYTHSQVNLRIDCDIHGSFWQRPSNHLRGTGCPRCKNSKGETKIAKVLSRRGVRYVKEHIFKDCVGDKGAPLKFDFYIPSRNVLIEYDGEQHFKLVKFHQKMTQEVMEEMFERTQRYDQIKNKYAKQQQIKLIRIPYTEINNIETLLDNL